MNFLLFITILFGSDSYKRDYSRVYFAFYYIKEQLEAKYTNQSNYVLNNGKNIFYKENLTLGDLNFEEFEYSISQEVLNSLYGDGADISPWIKRHYIFKTYFKKISKIITFDLFKIFKRKNFDENNFKDEKIEVSSKLFDTKVTKNFVVCFLNEAFSSWDVGEIVGYAIVFRFTKNSNEKIVNNYYQIFFDKKGNHIGNENPLEKNLTAVIVTFFRWINMMNSDIYE